MEWYYEAAKELAGFYNACHGISTLPLEPISNMFHVQFHQAKEQVEPILTEVQQQTGIGLTSYLKEIDKNKCSFEVSLGDLYETVPRESLKKVFEQLDALMKQRFSSI